MSLKLEYRHDFLDDVEAEQTTVFFEDDDDGDTIDGQKEASVDFERDTIRAVLSWRMNWFDW